MEALHRLKSTEPPLWLAPSAELSQVARTASQYLFSSLKPYAAKSPLDQLLVDGFDAEQIWQQIDIQSQPLLSGLRREIKHFEKNPEEIRTMKEEEEKKGKKRKNNVEEEGKEMKGLDDFDDDGDMDMDMDFDMDGVDDDDEEEEEEEGEGKEGEEQEGGGMGIEDKFLKINELEEYLEEDEAREFGLDTEKKNKNKKRDKKDFDEEDEDEEEDDDELGFFDDDDDEEADMGQARYEDFFVKNKKKTQQVQKQDELSTDEKGKKGDLSTHEKQLKKVKSEIEQIEKENLAEKVWMMRGEVTAANRPKNSALEVDLDFDHNVRPAPVITEEVTASLEDIIKNRIVEGRFDDVQKAPSLLSKGPRELKELDENKSKKGLAEVYEEDYVQKTNPTAAPLSATDELKKEANLLFKKICLKLDALSHFHFAPKPVIEDMSVQANVPAIAMEEIAPVGVSDAAMLAPEEVFAGKGDIKEEAELTKAERKRRRANKKRKFKAGAAQKMAKKARDNTELKNDEVLGPSGLTGKE